MVALTYPRHPTSFTMSGQSSQRCATVNGLVHKKTGGVPRRRRQAQSRVFDLQTLLLTFMKQRTQR